jgi:hypothetical protein
MVAMRSKRTSCSWLRQGNKGSTVERKVGRTERGQTSCSLAHRRLPTSMDRPGETCSSGKIPVSAGGNRNKGCGGTISRSWKALAPAEPADLAAMRSRGPRPREVPEG